MLLSPWLGHAERDVARLAGLCDEEESPVGTLAERVGGCVKNAPVRPGRWSVAVFGNGLSDGVFMYNYAL